MSNEAKPAPEIPSILGAIEYALRAATDEWDDKAVHVSDLGFSLPVAAGGRCQRQLWLRLRGAPRRELNRGELMMFRNANEMHLDASMLLGYGLPKTAPGWQLVRVEHSLRAKAGMDLGFAPDKEDAIETGQLDNELLGPAGEVVIVDYKTRRGAAFRYLDIEGPSARDVLQIRTYMRKRNAVAGVLVYLDREGQNFGREYPVTRADDEVIAAAEQTWRIAASMEAPPILEPILERKENKGPDSLILKAPWPCATCVFLDESCPGALPPSCRELGDRVVANITDKGELKWKENVPAEAMTLVERLLWRA